MSNEFDESKKPSDDMWALFFGIYLAGLLPCSCEEIEAFEEYTEPDSISECDSFEEEI